MISRRGLVDIVEESGKAFDCWGVWSVKSQTWLLRVFKFKITQMQTTVTIDFNGGDRKGEMEMEMA